MIFHMKITFNRRAVALTYLTSDELGETEAAKSARLTRPQFRTLVIKVAKEEIRHLWNQK